MKYAAFVFLVACGGSTPTPASLKISPSTIDVDQAENEVFGVLCERRQECDPSAFTADGVQHGYDSIVSCTAYELSVVQLGESLSLKPGASSDPANADFAAACEEAIRASVCATLIVGILPSACTE